MLYPWVTEDKRTEEECFTPGLSRMKGVKRMIYNWVTEDERVKRNALPLGYRG